ncbi:RrF2 family transcriptional regulator [soil metagenome]|nr:Rrf2 family transcriptional regulator [Trueperaceae bacterium]
MRLSSTDVYAFHALGYLGTREPSSITRSEEISEATGVARPYLVRVLATLVASGLVASKKGAGGGYALARPAEEINLRDVMRAIDGPIAPLSCVSLKWHEPCPEETRCHARSSIYLRLRDVMLEALSHATVADLVRDVAAGVDYRHCLGHVLSPN